MEWIGFGLPDDSAAFTAEPEIPILHGVWQRCGCCARPATCIAERAVHPGHCGAHGSNVIFSTAPEWTRIIQVCRRCYIATDVLLPGCTDELTPEERANLDAARALMVPARDLAHADTPIALRAATP